MRKLTLFVMLSLGLSAMAFNGNKSPKKVRPNKDDTKEILQILSPFADSLIHLVLDYRQVRKEAVVLSPNVCLSPYFYQMVTPTALYQQPLRQTLGLNWQPGSVASSAGGEAPQILPSSLFEDSELSRLYHSNQALSAIYAALPTLVTYTEKEIEESGGVLKDVDVPIKSEAKMQEEIQLAQLEEEDHGEVMAQLRRPNFWKFKGSNSLQLTQNFATDNWFQGKANHYNALGIVNVEANFNNQRKVQWDNRLDLQLGFQTNSESDQNKFKPTNNLMRLNSKLGIKAAKNWFYTFNVKAETQLVPNYQYKKQKDENGVEYTKRSIITDFLSPLNVDISVGIDWKLNKKRFSSSLVLAPLTYNIKYVEQLPLSTRYGVDEGHHTKHSFGPSATYKFNWKIADNINWDSRLYWISNLHYTNVEFENTLTFSINKYLTSKFFFYPRFNDQSTRNRMPDSDGNHTGTYWMFKEFLSLGISYNW